VVQVLVYDVTGRHLRRLVSGAIAAGRHVVPWDGRGGAGRAVAGGETLMR
jgi:hypothetical protein